MGIEHVNPPVEDFLVWRDLRVFDGKKVPSLFSFFDQHQICSLSTSSLNAVCSLAYYHLISRDSLVLVVH